MSNPSHSRGTIISREGQIAVTLFLPVLPEFKIVDEGRGDKGCLTLIIESTGDTEIGVCFDGHYELELTALGEAITKAGGIKAKGALGFGREHTPWLQAIMTQELQTVPGSA